MAALNVSQDIRLTRAELAAIPSASTVIDSTRFGVMWAQGNGGSVNIDGGTILSGVSYLTSLTVESGAAIVGATVTVNGTVTAVAPGTTYTGAIVVTPS